MKKTNVKTPYLEQFKTIGNKDRDPRGWTVTTVYFALIPANKLELKSSKGCSDIKWSKIINGKVNDKLGFDHAEMLQECYQRLRQKILYTSLPIYLMPSAFTLGELQKAYEIILAKKIDHKSFRRRMLNVDLLLETGEMRSTGRKPAKLYRLKEDENTHFFMRTIEAC